MSDPTVLQNAIEAVIFARLTQSLPGVTVGQHLPEDTAPPFVVIGQITAEDRGGKDDPFWLFTVEITSLVKATGRRDLNVLQAKVDAALNRWRPADANGVSISAFQPSTTTGGRFPDDEYEGSQRFQAFVQPV